MDSLRSTPELNSISTEQIKKQISLVKDEIYRIGENSIGNPISILGGHFGITILHRYEHSSLCVVKIAKKYKYKMTEEEEENLCLDINEILDCPEPDAVLPELSMEETALEIQHPNLVQLYEIKHLKKFKIFYQEYLPHGSLKHWLEYFQGLPSQVLIHFTAQLTLAVSYLHDHNIMHRDLNSENCLISFRGDLKVTSFTWATFIEDVGSSTICGELNYMAPELFKTENGECCYGKSVDWWATGVIIYEMLNGYLPFRTNDNFKTNNRKKMVKLIMESHPEFTPNSIEKNGLIVTLIKQLLEKSLYLRLGTGLSNGLSTRFTTGFHKNSDLNNCEILRHDCFSGIDLAQLVGEKVQSPFLKLMFGKRTVLSKSSLKQHWNARVVKRQLQTPAMISRKTRVKVQVKMVERFRQEKFDDVYQLGGVISELCVLGRKFMK